MFHHHAWAVGSYSSGPPAWKLSKSKSTQPRSAIRCPILYLRLPLQWSYHRFRVVVKCVIMCDDFEALNVRTVCKKEGENVPAPHFERQLRAISDFSVTACLLRGETRFGMAWQPHGGGEERKSDTLHHDAHSHES